MPRGDGSTSASKHIQTNVTYTITALPTGFGLPLSHTPSPPLPTGFGPPLSHSSMTFCACQQASAPPKVVLLIHSDSTCSLRTTGTIIIDAALSLCASTIVLFQTLTKGTIIINIVLSLCLHPEATQSASTRGTKRWHETRSLPWFFLKLPPKAAQSTNSQGAKQI